MSRISSFNKENVYFNKKIKDSHKAENKPTFFPLVIQKHCTLFIKQKNKRII